MAGCCLLTSAQEENDFVDVDEELVELSDTLVPTEEDIQANWTPEQRWLHGLCFRLDSVLQRDLYVTKTVRRGRGKKARYSKQTVKRSYKVGVHIYDLTADSAIYAHNAHELYIPASNQKLFVSIAALSSVGAGHNFFTDIYTDGHEKVDRIPRYELKHDTLRVDTALVVRTDTLSVDTVERSYLKGNVYVRGGFDPTLDKTAIDYIVGKLMALDVDSIDGMVYGYEPQKSQVSGAWFWSKHPSRSFPSLLYEGMRENDIAFSTENAYGSISTPMKIDGQWITSLNTPLQDLLYRMMKNSDNYYAESMLLNLCDLRDESTWNYEGCKQRVRDMTAKAGVQPDEYVIADGSGLSHANKSTPVALTSILRFAYHDKAIFDPLYESLPIAGVDGTIGSRMRGSAAYNNVRAKTGTVNGVSTLSGYVTAPNGHLLAFSILVNNVSNAVGRHLQDLLCIEMAQ